MHYTRWRVTGDPEKVTTQARGTVRKPKVACAVIECTRIAISRGWCTRHYTRWCVTGDPLKTKKAPPEQWSRDCSVEGCGTRAKSRGYCNQHYRRVLKFGDPSRTTYVRAPGRPCGVEGCARPHAAKGFCRMHWARVQLTGDPGGVEPGWQFRPEGCSVPECDRPHRSNGYCASHCQTLIRKRRLRAVFDEPVHMKVLIERGGWLCGLCKAPVDPTLEWPDSMSASIDHIVPIARGGRHAYSNVQLAHLSCNVRKRDKLNYAA